MSESPQDTFDHVAELAELYLLDEISDDQLAELEALVRRDAQAAEAMRSVLKQAGMMRVVFSEQQQFASRIGEADRDEYLALLQTLQPTEEPELVHVVGHIKPRQPLWQQWPAIMGAVAALVVLTLTLTLVFQGSSPTPNTTASNLAPWPDRPTPTRTHVATFTAEHNAQWAQGAFAPGSPLHANQRLTLTAGFAEITTNDGAIAILEAPATIGLTDNDNAVYLHVGKLVGLCHTESSKGFVVKTDHADITDLGTEFGVSVTPNAVETTVFVGKVTLNTPDGASQPITTNQTAQLTVEGSKRLIAVENKPTEGFARRVPRQPLVTAAYINDARFRVDVAPQSCFEDAKVHTDRDHEINGLDGEGLPAELLGADVILTPGDARPSIAQDAKDLKIEIETSRPAEVYLLLREGHRPPDWVLRDYIKTDLRAGIDFGPSQQTRDASVGIGPGQSIDGVQHVWRRKQPVEGRALVAEQMAVNSAYVLLAVPVHETP